MANTIESIEQRFNQLNLNKKANLRERILNKLSEQARKELKELSLLDKKYKSCEKKLNATLNNIENIDEYLAKKENNAK